MKTTKQMFRKKVQFPDIFVKKIVDKINPVQ
jgi:hypothetical protein